MRTYPPSEIHSALKNAPEAVRDFAVSPTLMRIYEGIDKKHGLSFRESLIISRFATLCLLGLESESAFETNIHQALPELSNAATHELVADISTRVFKESRRRLDENILEPSEYSDVLTAAPETGIEEYVRLNNLDDDSPERAALLAKEEDESRRERKEAADRLLEETAKKASAPATDSKLADYLTESVLSADTNDDEGALPKSTYELELEALENEFAKREAALLQESSESPLASSSLEKNSSTQPARQISGVSLEQPPVDTSRSSDSVVSETPATPIAQQKLATTSTAQEKTFEIPNSLAQTKISLINKAAQPPPRVTSDPYRETPD